MEAGESDELILRLQQKLREVEARFEAEARRRGFDPAQAENMALPGALAVLFNERDEISLALAELAEQKTEEYPHAE